MNVSLAAAASDMLFIGKLCRSAILKRKTSNKGARVYGKKENCSDDCWIIASELV